MTEWQPIETAPKDGPLIDIWVLSSSGLSWRECNVYWGEGRDSYEGDDGIAESIREGWIAPCKNQGKPVFCDRPKRLSGQNDGGYYIDATHWMHRPAPPT